MRNNEQFNNTKLIPLTKGLIALVDPIDFDYLAEFSWIADDSSTTNYAYRVTKNSEGKRTNTRMHIDIVKRMGLKRNPSDCIDHINGNGIDNRRCNLRVITRSQNTAIRHRSHRPINKDLKHPGVYRQTRGDKYYSSIYSKGVRYYLGTFETKEDARAAYLETRKQLLGALVEGTT
jgi:hypothetical protein